MHRYEKWREALNAATTPVALERLVAEYADCILPSETAKLPASCQLILKTPAADIAASAVILLREELIFQGDPETGALLHEIAHTFVAASTRLTQMQRMNPRS
jgi:hypothetical protein